MKYWIAVANGFLAGWATCVIVVVSMGWVK